MVRLIVVSTAMAIMFAVSCREKRAVQEQQAQISPEEMVLPPEVGQVVEKVIKGEELKQKMPSGWAIESVQIRGKEIVVTCTGQTGEQGEVVLGIKTTQAGVGGGKWFSIKVTGPEGLSVVGKEIDNAFETNPWKPPKREKPVLEEPAPQPGPLGPSPQSENSTLPMEGEKPHSFPKSVAFSGVVVQIAVVTFALVYALKD